jgi:hypothetical protein
MTYAEQYADDVFAVHGDAEQVEAHMESEGFSEDDISEQLQRLGFRRVYVMEYTA